MASPGTTRRGKVDRKVASVGHRFRVPNNLSAELSTMSIIGSSDLIGRAPGGRKLIAVVYADMVGYSRLIGLDDTGTLQRLRTLRNTLINPAIDEHGGKIVQTGGDSLLIVFDSIDGAVRCAIRMQQHVPDYDGDHPPRPGHPVSRRHQHW
jgi:class 3 adenylate cyclase